MWWTTSLRGRRSPRVSALGRGHGCRCPLAVPHSSLTLHSRAPLPLLQSAASSTSSDSLASGATARTATTSVQTAQTASSQRSSRSSRRRRRDPALRLLCLCSPAAVAPCCSPLPPAPAAFPSQLALPLLPYPPSSFVSHHLINYQWHLPMQACLAKAKVFSGANKIRKRAASRAGYMRRAQAQTKEGREAL